VVRSDAHTGDRKNHIGKPVPERKFPSEYLPLVVLGAAAGFDYTGFDDGRDVFARRSQDKATVAKIRHLKERHLEAGSYFEAAMF
jgi:hypothetical protein